MTSNSENESRKKPQARFVCIVKGTHKGNEGYIVGETKNFFWIKICSECDEPPTEKVKVLKENVIPLNLKIPTEWKLFADTDSCIC